MNPSFKFAEVLGLSFSRPELLEQAFIHRSYLNEHRDLKREHNERLEFLGDAVLELAVTDFLFQQYPAKSEGELTALRAALVNTGTLAAVASDLKLNDYLLLSRGEAKDTGRARLAILANTFEAVIGAIYLDQGYDAASRFITATLLAKTEDIVANNLWQDAKSYFQEKAQEHTGITPAYRVLQEIGPDHDKRFVVGLYLGAEQVAVGEGHSKQEAEQAAAQQGLTAKNWNGKI
jgi:ribonuclease-3